MAAATAWYFGLRAGQSSLSQWSGLEHRVYQNQAGDGDRLPELFGRTVKGQSGGLEKGRNYSFLQGDVG